MAPEVVKDVEILFGLALELKEGDIVLLLGTPEQLGAAGKLFESPKYSGQHVSTGAAM